MPTYPESGIKLVVDTTDALSAVSDLQSALDDIQGGTYTATVETVVDDSGLSDLPGDGETIDATVDVTQTGDELPPDGETIDTTINTEVQAADPNSKGILDTLNSINAKQTFQMLLDIGGTAVDFFKSVSGFAVQPMLDLDNALARLKATTGETIPNADKLINGIFYSDLGESIDEVAKLVGQAHQLKAPLDESVTAALNFTKVFTDQNPENVLNTLNQLVLNKLEPNFTKAGDDLVTAFQNGANKGGDLLDSLNHNATAIHDLGLNGPQALTLVTNALHAGFTSADEVFKTLENIKKNVQGAAGNTTSNVTQTLNLLGVANPAETGKAWSADFFKSVIEGIQKAPVSDSEKMVMFQNLVGGKLSTKEFSSFMKLSPEDAAGIFENTKGAAATAAQAIDDSLSGAIKDFELAAQKAAVDFLSSKQIDLPGKIAALKGGLQDALNVLSEGGSLGEALTIALKPIGFDDEFQGLESALGNFVIGILQAVAAIQDATGHGTEAGGTRATIAGMAKQQLAFDLQVDNPDEIATSISTAVSRGVKPEDIAKSAATAVTELVKSGASGTAQAIIDNLNQQAQTGVQLHLVGDPNEQANAKKMIESLGLGTVNADGTITMNITPDMDPALIQSQADTIVDVTRNAFGYASAVQVPVTPTIDKDGVAALQKLLNDSMKGQSDDIKQKSAEARLNAADAADAIAVPTADLKTAATDTAPTVQTVADNTKKVGDNATKAALPLNNQATDTTKVGNAAATAAPKLSNAGDQLQYVTVQADSASIALTSIASSLDVIINKASAVGNAADDLAKKNANTPPATNTNTKPGLGHASGSGDASGTFMAGESGREIISTNKSLAVLNNMSTEAILSALQGYIPGGYSGNTSHVSNTINNVNIVPNEATADSLGYRQAATLRGMN